MKLAGRYNNALTGVVSGIIVPCIAFLVFYLVTAHGLSPKFYLQRMEDAGNFTQVLSVSVFANIIIFLLFNRLDMLKASKGVLGITIVWALIIFGIKLF